MNVDAITSAVLKVGGGRGFIVGSDFVRYVITAAHCLPRLPPAHPASYLEDRTYRRLLGTLDDPEPKVWAECLFADPVADVAVLGEPDGQELFAENEGYTALIGARPALRLETGMIRHEGEAWVLQLDGRITPCRYGIYSTLEPGPRTLWLEGAEVHGGMSDSPVLGEGGNVIGLVSTGAFADPLFPAALPHWLVDLERAGWVSNTA